MVGDVLVVDDSSQSREVLSLLLTSNGHSVRLASGGHEALRLAHQRAPDLVLLDLHMPDLDGFSVCRTLRERWGRAQLPVVFHSSAQDPVNRLKTFESSAVDFVTKPFHFEEVLARVATHLELKRSTAQLERANTKLQQVEVERRRFITALVHDIKNPLTPMLTNTGWLLEQPMGDVETAEVLRDLHVASHQLHRMVLSLLDVSKAAERGLTVRHQQVPLRAWLDDALTLPRLQLRCQPGRLQVTVGEGEGRFDPALFARVLQNLIDNALKHAPREQPIRVELSQGPGGLRLAVEDRGPGVRALDRERIFAAWTQLEATVPGSAASYGIGLAFCRDAVEAHGGSIDVEAAEPHGARFVVRVPPTAG